MLYFTVMFKAGYLLLFVNFGPTFLFLSTKFSIDYKVQLHQPLAYIVEGWLGFRLKLRYWLKDKIEIKMGSD